MATGWGERGTCHPDDDIGGETADETGAVRFVCDRKGHPTEGNYEWPVVPPPPRADGIGGLAADLDLDSKLPEALEPYAGKWVEYGVLEHSFADQLPDELSRTKAVWYHDGPATGYWSYNSDISWWSSTPEPRWTSDRLSWVDANLSIDYVHAAAR